MGHVMAIVGLAWLGTWSAWASWAGGSLSVPFSSMISSLSQTYQLLSDSPASHLHKEQFTPASNLPAYLWDVEEN